MPEEVMRIINLKGEYDYYQHTKGEAHHYRAVRVAEGAFK